MIWYILVDWLSKILILFSVYGSVVISMIDYLKIMTASQAQIETRRIM